MSNPLDALKGAPENPMEAIDNAIGKYKDAVEADTNTMSKLPQASLPQAQDPNPFSLGPLKKGE